MKNMKIACIGSDKRLFCCAESLGERGYETALYGFEGISDRARSTRCPSPEDALSYAKALVLPLPLSKDDVLLNLSCGKKVTLEALFKRVEEGTEIFAGLVSDGAREIAKKFGHCIHDYYQNEAYVLKNAAATAEGAIYLAMIHSERTLRGSRCLVTGYGRIGSCLARLLVSLGAYVSICARRKESRVSAELDGCDAFGVGDIPKYIGGYDFIFNTVPENIITREACSCMGASQIYIELASTPFGADFSLLEQRNVEVVKGNSLPSKYCPESAGEYIADYVCDLLSKKEAEI